MNKIKKIWNFIFHEDSLLSWIVNIILAFVIVKYLIYPLLGLVLSTSYPLVAVVSSSMDHTILAKEGSNIYEICGEHFSEEKYLDIDEYWKICGNYYESKFYITKPEFQQFPYSNGFKKGDIMILLGSKNIKTGDIIVYSNPNYQYPIIHRVVKGYKKNSITYYKTKGDHNNVEDPMDTDQPIGKVIWRIPKLGYIKIIFINYIVNPILGR